MKYGGMGMDLENIKDLTEPASAGIRMVSAAAGKLGRWWSKQTGVKSFSTWATMKKVCGGTTRLKEKLLKFNENTRGKMRGTRET
jgi:hypothetical protein